MQHRVAGWIFISHSRVDRHYTYLGRLFREPFDLAQGERRMARFTTILSLSLPLALMAGAAVGQTVADYKTALETATVVDAAGCRTLTNYVYTAIPESKRAAWVLPLVTINGSEEPTVVQNREACAEARKLPLIAFDGGTGEQIVTPAEAYKDSVDQPYYRDPTVPNDATPPRAGRALRRVGTP
jgi:hypothetical protein